MIIIIYLIAFVTVQGVVSLHIEWYGTVGARLAVPLLYLDGNPRVRV